MRQYEIITTPGTGIASLLNDSKRRRLMTAPPAVAVGEPHRRPVAMVTIAPGAPKAPRLGRRMRRSANTGLGNWRTATLGGVTEDAFAVATALYNAQQAAVAAAAAKKLAARQAAAAAAAAATANNAAIVAAGGSAPMSLQTKILIGTGAAVAVVGAAAYFLRK